MQLLRVCLLSGGRIGVSHRSFVICKPQLLSYLFGNCRPSCHSYSQHIYSLRRRKQISCEGLCMVEDYKRFLDCASHLHVRFCSHSVFSQDTIYALSSGHGKCGVALIRVTGTKAKDALLQIGQFSKLPQARMAKHRKLRDPETKEVIDIGLIVWFPGPYSFTGEDCVEFQVHGGSAVVVAMMNSLAKLSGLRPAEAGEFTKRAFMNGKLDLTEVEGLADLIHAETEAQRKQAVRQMQGDLSKLYNDWRTRLIQYTAMLEAFIDFSEDENIEEDVIQDVSRGVSQLIREIQHHLQDNRRGERLREGVHVAIVGQPNVGKSSLLNSICQRPAAIVSPTAGTTRDVIETAVNIGDFPILLSDTAGLRETSDDVEKEGVRRGLSRAKDADILILMLEAPFISYQMQNDFNLTEFIQNHLCELGITECSCQSKNFNHIQRKTSLLGKRSDNTALMSDDCHEEEQLSQVDSNRDSVINNVIDVDNIIVIFNKCDLVKNHVQKLKDIGNHDNLFTVCTISCVSGDGYDSFLQILKEKVEKMCGNPLAFNPSLTQARHRNHLTKCLQRLKLFQDNMEREDVVLAAEALRRALREVGKITGRVTSEDILDVIFRDFCIGK